MKSVERAGSRPAASQSVATSRMFSRIVRGVGVVGGERVPVHDREEAVVLVLQAHPVVEGAGQVAEVQRPRGPHAGEDAGTGHAHQAAKSRPRIEAAGSGAST